MNHPIQSVLNEINMKQVGSAIASGAEKLKASKDKISAEVKEKLGNTKLATAAKERFSKLSPGKQKLLKHTGQLGKEAGLAVGAAHAINSVSMRKDIKDIKEKMSKCQDQACKDKYKAQLKKYQMIKYKTDAGEGIVDVGIINVLKHI